MAAVLSLAADTLTATPSTTVTFSYTIGGAVPAPVTINVKDTATNAAYTTSIAPSSALWLTVSPESGKMPAALSFRANPTGLGASTSAVVTVTAGAATLTINVYLNISAPLPTLNLSSTSLNFVSPPSPVAQSVNLSTTGTAVTYTASAAGTAWITITPCQPAGVVLPGAICPLQVAVDPTSLTPQAKAYTGKITITASGTTTASKTQTINVGLTVNPPVPTITGLWPSTVQANTGAATITVFGTGFYSGSGTGNATVIKVGGTTLTTPAPVLVSPTVMQINVPSTMLTAPGTLNIVATNPAPGGDSATTLASTLTISGAPAIAAVVNSASYSSGAISPGELITLFGAGIGPSAPVFATTTPDASNDIYVDTSIGGLSVTIDGYPAPILYADPNQINVQVPYEVNQGSTKNIVVTNGTSTPAQTTVTIQSEAPGIFVSSSDGSGAGQAIAIVFPASATGVVGFNSQTTAAHAGDTIEFFVTGEGAYLSSSPSPTGLIIPVPNTQITPLPTVTVGGVQATVKYAGPIPGAMTGVLQINALLGTGMTTGNTSPLVVNFNGSNGYNTQSGVTMVVK
ncbi:MAG TPA: hypothetical protein VKU01_05045 [Bryobacteraceae bacterium]|nr:hypothetical protein [Bryobacteraceae bacterium]